MEISYESFSVRSPTLFPFLAYYFHVSTDAGQQCIDCTVQVTLDLTHISSALFVSVNISGGTVI